MHRATRKLKPTGFRLMPVAIVATSSSQTQAKTPFECSDRALPVWW